MLGPEPPTLSSFFFSALTETGGKGGVWGGRRSRRALPLSASPTPLPLDSASLFNFPPVSHLSRNSTGPKLQKPLALGHIPVGKQEGFLVPRPGLRTALLVWGKN